MKTIITAALIGTAALSLAACSKGENAAANTETVALNESDIPAEGNFGAGELSNDTLGFDNSLAGDNALTPVDNATAPATNAL
jgi:hypothetical protein